MKTMILSFMLALLLMVAKAQPATDIIVKHTGEKLNVTIVSVDDKITFTYPSEKAVQSISKNCVREVIFSSGRVQEITEKVVVSGEDDWKKVIITNDPEDVKCLVRKGEVSGSANNTWSFKSKKGVDDKATMKIKKQAAKLKAYIILIQDQTKTGETVLTGASSDKSGVAYGYE